MSFPFQTTCDRLYNVLLFPDGGWLIDTNTEEQEQDAGGTSGQDSGEGQAETSEPNRSHHLSVLRSIYIPQVGPNGSFVIVIIKDKGKQSKSWPLNSPKHSRCQERERIVIIIREEKGREGCV